MSVPFRSAALRIVLVIAFAFLATIAHAEPSARLSAGLFTPQRNEDGLAWRVRFVLSPEAAADVRDGGFTTIRFANPLGPDARLEPRDGITELRENDRVVGVVVREAALKVRDVTLTVQQHVPDEKKPSLVLAAPLASGTTLQIIDADLGSGTRLEVAPNVVLEKHVGFMAPAGTGESAREEARRLTGYEERVSGAAIYARGDDVRVSSGLRATLETPRDRGKPGVVGAALVFGAVVVALLFAVNRLRHAATLERADALLAAEVDALSPDSRKETRF